MDAAPLHPSDKPLQTLNRQRLTLEILRRLGTAHRLLLGLLLLILALPMAGRALGQAAGPSNSQNPVLIFIHSEDMSVFPDNTPAAQRMYVLWPVFLNSFGSNRLLSIFSGADWQATDFSRSFRENGAEAWVPSDPQEMRSIGYYKARSKIVGGQQIRPIASSVGLGAVSLESLMLSADGSENEIRTVPHDGNWPWRVPLVYRAASWSDAQSVIQHAEDTGGRALLVVLPPRDVNRWGRLWLSPKGWPNGLPIDPQTGTAGLITARSLGRLLLQPEQFKWQIQPASANDLGAWFRHVRETGTSILGILSLMILFTLGMAVYIIVIEQRGPLAACLIVGCALSPCGFILMDEMGRLWGVGLYGFWMAAAAAVMTLGGFIFYIIFRKLFAGVHALFWSVVPGLAVLAFCDPRWSIFSQTFGFYTPHFSSEAMGTLAAMLTALIAFSRGGGKWAEWFARLVAAAFIVTGALYHPWWVGDNRMLLAVPVLAWVAGEGRLRLPLMAAFALVPNPYSNPFLHGFAWAPSYCFKTLNDDRAVNLGTLFISMFSPAMVLLCTVVGCTLLFGDRFLIRQMKMVYRKDPRVLAIGWTTVGLIAMAAFTPAFVLSAVFSAFGLIFVLFFDAVWAL